MGPGDRLDRVREEIEKAGSEGDRLREVGLLENLADIYFASDGYDQALLQYEKIAASALWHTLSGADRARVCYKTSRAHLAMGELENALRLSQKAERLASSADEPLLAGRIYALGGQINRRIGNQRDALAYSLRALDVLRHTNENREIASVQLTCGSIFLRQGNLSEAVRYFQDSLATYRRIDDEEGIAKAYNNLGVAYKDLCQWENAAQALKNAIEIDRRFGNYAGVALRMLNLGLIQFRRGDWQGSRRRTERSLQMSRAVKDNMGVTLCSLALARIARHQRRWSEARRHALEALRLSKANGNRREIAASWEELGAWCLDRGRRGSARALLGRSLSVAERIGEKSDHVAEINRRLCEEAAASNRPAEAIALAKKSLRAAASIRDMRLVGSGLRALAAGTRLQGNAKRAAFYAARSVRIFKACGIPFDLGRSLLESARIASENGDVGCARSELVRAEAIFRRLGLNMYSARVLIEFARLKIRTDRLEDAVVLLQKAERLSDGDPPGHEAAEIERLRRSIEERFAECSLSESNRFLALRESVRDPESVLVRVIHELNADRGFLFQRSEDGSFVLGDRHGIRPAEALGLLRETQAEWLSGGLVKPFISIGGGGNRGSRTCLIAPTGAGDAGVYLERPIDPAGKPFLRRDLEFLVGVAREAGSAPPAPRASSAGATEAGFAGIVTRSKRMLEILAMLRKLSGVNATILLQGETGTGKGLLAYEISRGDPAPFVTINCADLTETILESELFGHAKNAFTGAGAAKKGLFEVADGGTVFIDEIDKTSRRFQEKLLRVVDRREFKPVGSVDLRRVECRIICASNRDLREEVEKKRFLKDLYYRLNVISIQLPPLRERPEDIPILAGHFFAKFSHSMGKEGVRLAEAAVDLFSRYAWPGNVRDLQNEIERAVALASPGETIGIDSLSDELVAFARSGGAAPVGGERNLARMVEDLEGRVIREALRQHDGNKSRVARHLGLTRKGLRNKILRYKIDS
ncbi:MAG: sigma 54-interacting transcriptional regulator [Candidatus Eisenbacteria bacterium]